MILFRDFNEKTRMDRVWYDSSMIIYSECYDKPDTPLKDLKVTFKNGATYEYKDVDVNDYVAFVHGGLDNSNGKALNKFIKPKCECKKIEFKTIAELNEDLEELRSVLKEQMENKSGDE